MTAPPATCPSALILRDFGLGKLDAANSATVSRHIETCADCRERVAGVSGDSFVGRLRNAGGAVQGAAEGPRTYMPAESLANSASSTPSGDLGRSSSETGGPARPPQEQAQPPISAPPELANHPDYELVKELGQGGMGTVYLARNRMMDRPEVLKVISKSLLDRPGSLERFQQEIRSAAKLAHPNIVAAYSVLRPGELLVFAMEYVRGQDLSQVVKQRGPLPVSNAAFYVHQVANGLQHAFEKGMVHRDIKPNNLMLAIDGKKHVVKILDFGLAKATSEKGAEAGLTKSGQMLGTPDYVAPEQTLAAHKADIRADIYSLGCTLYFLLSGGPPFQETSLYEILEAHHKRDPKPLNFVRPDVSIELAAVVAKMMAKDPAKRYQTPIEVARALVPFFKPGQSILPPSRIEAGQSHTGAATEHGINGVTPASPIARLPTWLPLPVASPVAPMAMPLPTTEPTEEFGVSINTHRPAPNRRRGGWSSLSPWQRRAATAGAVAILLLGVTILIRTPKGTITIALSEPNAKVNVTIDGDRMDIAGLHEPLSLEVGEHEIKVNGTGHETWIKQFKITRGKNSPLTVTLVPLAKSNSDSPDPTLAGQPKVDISKRFAFAIPDPRRARWSIDGDQLVQSAVDWRIDMIFGEPEWEEFDFSVEVQRIDGNDLVGIRFGHQDDWNTNIFQVAGQGNVLHSVDSVEDGRGRQLDSRQGSLAAGRWYRLMLRVRGNSGQCFLDDEPILSFKTERPSRGRIGLRTWDSIYRFRKILVQSPDGKILLEGLPDLDVDPPTKAYEEQDIEALAARGGVLPTAADGRPLNFDFETGDLQDWTREGNAFVAQPVKGDALHSRYKYLRSRHAGQFWIGGNGVPVGGPIGRLTSAPFKVTHPYASFLMATGNRPRVAVELVAHEGHNTIFRAVGHGSDTLDPVAVDLRDHLGEDIYIRVIDDNDDQQAWVRFDDFRFHTTEPDFSPGYVSSVRMQEGTAIDVLKLVDPDRDTRGGQWHWDEARRLVGDGWRMIRLPVRIPSEYDLGLTLEGNPNVGETFVWLQVGGRQVRLTIDGWGKSVSGLDAVDGKSADANDTTHRGPVLVDGRPNRLVCQVRAGSVKITCDGTLVVDWHGEPQRLSPPSGAHVAGWDGVLIGGGGGEYRISKIDLTPVGGTLADAPATEIKKIKENAAREPSSDAATQILPPVAQKAPRSDGWVPLFNGKDLGGWKTLVDDPGVWRVKNGVLIGNGGIQKNSFILRTTREDFTDFHLRIEARINDGGYGGVNFRTAFAPDTTGQVRMNDGAYHAAINSTNENSNKTGSLGIRGRGPAVAVPGAAAPHNRWFVLEVIAAGNRIQLKVDGRTTADYVNPAQVLDHGAVALIVTRGPHVIQFRKVEIKEL